MPKEDAIFCTDKYLRSFRNCPDNPSMTLHQWRSELWNKALPEPYRFLTDQIYELWLKNRYHYLQLPENLVQMLKQLRKNYLLAIITNGPSAAQWEKVHQLNLSELFDCILVSADFPFEKPDPKIFLAACQVLRVAPDNCIMVGDKLETDIQGGIEAGLLANIWLPLDYPNQKQPKDIVPEITIGNIMELQSMLLFDEPPTNVSNNGGSNSSSGTSTNNGNTRSLKFKSTSRVSGTSIASTSASSSCGNGGFSTKSKVAATTAPYPKRFLMPTQPDLFNNNSNASDGS